MKKLFISSLFVFTILSLNSSLSSQPLSEDEIDLLVNKTMNTFKVPGIAVGIVKDGEVVFARGYGFRSLESKKPVDANTLFGIASNTKAFTAAGLGILVDEGKISWDDKVIDHIPEFRLYDAYVTADFTIRDLLTHRSGMGLGAGDLMIWPDGNNFTRADIIHNLRYLKQTSPFRSKYDYDNNLYIVAGEVISRITGISWEDFIMERFFYPLEMKKSGPSFIRLKDTSNVIAAHAEVNGEVKVINRSKGELMNAAGGIYSSVNDLSRWVVTLLSQGAYGKESQQLISKKVHKELWTPQTLIPVNTSLPYNSHFAAYGLGFRVADVKGYLEVSHTGGLAGMVTQITMFPELNLGIIVLTNQQVGAAFTAITNQIKDGYLGVSGMDWVKLLSERVRQANEDASAITGEIWNEIASQQANIQDHPVDFDLYTGTFRDPWFGDVVVEKKANRLWFRSIRSPGLTGELLHYKGQTFIVKWEDRSLDADAFLLFHPDFEGIPAGIKMKAISPLTDFSYDFHDLEFQRVNDDK